MVFAGPEGKGVCPCCDVAVAVTPDRVAFVAFRNSEAGHRNIWLGRGAASFEAGDARGSTSFAAPIPVGQDPWTFDGCPHDGPSLALLDGKLHVAWMDAHTGTSRVYHAMSPVTEAQVRFHPRPLSPAGRGAQGRPKLAAGGGGRLHVVWEESLDAEALSAAPHGHATPSPGGAGRAILYAVSRDGGQSFSPPHGLVTAPAAYQMQPSIALSPDGTVYVAWNEIDQDGKHVVLARLAESEPRTP
jgi:hypothetical protein